MNFTRSLSHQLTLAIVTAVSALTWSFSAIAQDDDLSTMPAGKYQLDLGHASILWKVSHFGFSTYPGRFNDFSVDLNLDTAKFSNSKVGVEIKVDSIQTSYPYPEKEDFDKELAEGWFNSAEFPTITFSSTEVSELNGNNFTITGELTFMGKTLPLTLNATLNKFTAKHPLLGKPVIGFSATTTVDRTQWGLSKYAPNIGAAVNVEIEGEFTHGDD